ncbi:MAG: hypothetical protein JWN34_4017 [Bryobacterales bacterium]|nr:hypothetical protein [Bryobacterales bacterium]
MAGATDYLKPGMSMDALDLKLAAMSDTDFVKKMGAAKAKVLPMETTGHFRRPSRETGHSPVWDRREIT